MDRNNADAKKKKYPAYSMSILYLLLITVEFSISKISKHEVL